MYRTINMQMADGSDRDVPFKSCGTTAIRFKMLFGKELLGAITSIIDAAGPEGIKLLLGETAKAAVQGKDSIDPNEMDPDTLQAVIQIAGSGEMDSISKLAYIMNMAAVGSNMNELSMEKYLDWLDQFESMEFLTKSMEILDVYMSNRSTSVEPKKDIAQLTDR